MVRIVVEYSSESVQAPTFCRLGLISYSNAIGSIYPMGFTANDRLELAILSYTSQNSQGRVNQPLICDYPQFALFSHPIDVDHLAIPASNPLTCGGVHPRKWWDLKRWWAVVTLIEWWSIEMSSYFLGWSSSLDRSGTSSRRERKVKWIRKNPSTSYTLLNTIQIRLESHSSTPSISHTNPMHQSLNVDHFTRMWRGWWRWSNDYARSIELSLEVEESRGLFGMHLSSRLEGKWW